MTLLYVLFLYTSKMVIAGLLFRLRGAGLLPTQIGRIIFALGFSLLVLPYNQYQTYIFAALLWLGLLTGWGSYFSIGRNHIKQDDEFIKPIVRYVFSLFTGYKTPTNRDDRELYDMLGMTIRGALITLPAGLYMGHLWFALSGLGFGIVYDFAWRVPSKIKYFRRGTELGEVLFGMFLFIFAATIGG